MLDWFIPFNFEMLNGVDHDIGSAGVLLILGHQIPTNSAGKEGKALHFHPEQDSQIVQSLKVARSGIYGTPTYWRGPGGRHVYIWGSYDHCKMFRLRKHRLDRKPVSKTKERAKLPGGILSISANGAVARTGILWAVTPSKAVGHRGRSWHPVRLQC